MSWIITTRNPKNGDLTIILDGHIGGIGCGMDEIAEFDTEGEADAAASLIVVCETWGYHVVEVP